MGNPGYPHWVAEKWSSAWLSGPLTFSRAYRELLLTRRNSTLVDKLTQNLPDRQEKINQQWSLGQPRFFLARD